MRKRQTNGESKGEMIKVIEDRVTQKTKVEESVKERRRMSIYF